MCIKAVTSLHEGETYFVNLEMYFSLIVSVLAVQSDASSSVLALARVYKDDHAAHHGSQYSAHSS